LLDPEVPDNGGSDHDGARVRSGTFWP